MSQCCADTETSSCVTHLNEQPWLDTHCQSLAYRGQVATAASPKSGPSLLVTLF